MSDFVFTSYLKCFRLNPVFSGEVSMVAVRKRTILSLWPFHWSEQAVF